MQQKGHNGTPQISNCCSWQRRTENKGEHQLTADVHLHDLERLDQPQHTRDKDEAEVYPQFLVVGIDRLDKHQPSDNTLCTRRRVHTGLTRSAQISHRGLSFWLHDNAQPWPHYTTP